MNLSEVRCQVNRVPKVANPKVVQSSREMEGFWQDVLLLCGLVFLLAWALILCGLYA